MRTDLKSDGGLVGLCRTDNTILCNLLSTGLHVDLQYLSTVLIDRPSHSCVFIYFILLQCERLQKVCSQALKGKL